jgi:hypothetical protein
MHTHAEVVVIEALGFTAVVYPPAVVGSMHIIYLLPGPIVVEDYVYGVFPPRYVAHSCQGKGVITNMTSSF